MAVLMRFAALLATLMLLGAPQVASAYPAVNDTTWKYPTNASCASGTYTGSNSAGNASLTAACQAVTNNNAAACPSGGANKQGSTTYVGGGYCEGSWTTVFGSACTYNCYLAFPLALGSGPTCPNGGTLQGSECVCPAGTTDNGSACVQATCAANSDGGIQNFTVGWALSGVVGAPDTVYNEWGRYYDSKVCDEGCEKGIDVSKATEGECWRSSNPDPSNGLYRLSCDQATVKTGNQCSSTASNSAANPTQEKPPCNGTLGSVNGKFYCASNNPGNSVKLPKEKGGNPKAGSEPTETNAAREPTEGSGGAPDGRGGPGVTTRGDGGKGTGSDRTGGTSGGGGGIGTDPNAKDPIPPCGLPDTPKCKIDETGTPTSGSFADATKGIDDATKARQEGLATVTDPMGKNTSWTWTLALPTGCQPISLNMILKTVVFDPCAYQGVFHDLMSLLWAGATLFAVFGMVGRTLREA